MSLANFSLENLMKKGDLTFLVGAGCSIDSPSCLPTGREIIKTLIKFLCPTSEIDLLLNIKDLRFEVFIEHQC